MNRIIQISDIHLKGDYNGQFPVQENLDRVLEHIKVVSCPDGDSVILLTGDLVDNGTVEDYDKLLGQISEMFPETPIAVTPGNHDNCLALARSYNSYYMGPNGAKCDIPDKIRLSGALDVPGSMFMLLDVSPFTTLAIVDTSNQEFAYYGLFRLMPYLSGKNRPNFKDYEVHNVILATHYPLIPVQHRFMNDSARSLHLHSIYDDLMILHDEYHVKEILCGHYHHYCEKTFDGMRQIICPGTQMQLNPYSEECSPSGQYPGYLCHEIDPMGHISHTAECFLSK